MPQTPKPVRLFALKHRRAVVHPPGMHTHTVDQIFYILSGTMSIEIEGKQYDCTPGSLIVFPAGIRHRNWNGGNGPTIHLAFNTPLPDPNVPFAKSV